MAAPTAFYDVAESALSCICEAMDSLTDQEGVPDGYGCPCLQFVSAGPPAIECCTHTSGDCGPGGMLAVHVESIYPSDNFPSPSAGFQPCKAATWVAAIVVTAARCAPTIDEHGKYPAVADLNANALLMALDSYAITTALSCCLVNEGLGAKRIRRVTIGASRPITTDGGCSAIEVRAFVDAGSICACSPEAS